MKKAKVTLPKPPEQEPIMTTQDFLETISKIHYNDFIGEVISGKYEESVAVPEIARRHSISESTSLRYFKALTHPLAQVRDYWTLTQSQYIAISYEPGTVYGLSSYDDEELAKEDHESFVDEAIENGISVHNDVLKDYPHLKAKLAN